MYDYIVIGAGSGGIASGIRAAERGAKVIIIEKGEIGGTCVNRGCIPKKVFWNGANLINQFNLYKQYGITDKNDFTSEDMDRSWTEVVKIIKNYLKQIHESYNKSMVKNSVTYCSGIGRIIDNHTVKIQSKDGDKIITGKYILLATGGSPVRLPIEGGNYGITSDEFFSMSKRPRSGLIVGAGYITAELATIMLSYKVDVHIACRKHTLLRAFDHDIVKKLMENFNAMGATIYNYSQVQKVKKIGEDKYDVEILRNFEGQEEKINIQVDTIIWAVGRKSNFKDLFDKDFKVDLDDNGHFIKVDGFYQTSKNNIYAIGDIVNQAQLTPVAIKAGRYLADHLFDKRPFTFYNEPIYPLQAIPTAIYTNPPFATIGLTEMEAKKKYDMLIIYKATFLGTKRGACNGILNHDEQEENEIHRNVYKIVCYDDGLIQDNKPNPLVVGLHLFGDNADEIIQGFATVFAVRPNLRKSELDLTIALHPTSAEEIVTMKIPNYVKGEGNKAPGLLVLNDFYNKIYHHYIIAIFIIIYLYIVYRQYFRRHVGQK